MPLAHPQSITATSNYEEPCVAVAFATSYIANPDLVRRFQEGLPLAEVDQDSLYTPGAVGYSDYPDYTEA